MTSFSHLFDSQLPLINAEPWRPPSYTTEADENVLDEHGWEVQAFSFKIPELAPYEVEAWDPGYAHMGICTIRFGIVELHQCDIRSGKQYSKPSATQIAERVYDLFLGLTNVGYSEHVVMENASFGSPYGQANLGLVRGIISGVTVGRGQGLVFMSPSEYKKAIHGTVKVDYHKLSKHYPDAVAAYALALARCKQLEAK